MRLKYCLVLLLITIVPISMAQTITLENLKITPSGDNYLVSGTVIAKDLNPDGQIVEDDYVEIRAEMKKNPDSKYPVLYDVWGYTPPEGKSNYMKDGKFITYEEAKGKDIESHVVASMHLRDFPVWSAYGGLDKWRENAPSSVRMDFNGTIPKEYSGKEVRIHAILSHQWGGPNAYWPATTYHHWTETIVLPSLDGKSVDVSQPNSGDSTLGGMNSNNNKSIQVSTYSNDENEDNDFIYTIFLIILAIVALIIALVFLKSIMKILVALVFAVIGYIIGIIILPEYDFLLAIVSFILGYILVSKVLQ